jgi:hypothetical protein
MNRYALSFLNRQHSTNIQYAIENIQLLRGLYHISGLDAAGTGYYFLDMAVRNRSHTL